MAEGRGVLHVYMEIIIIVLVGFLIAAVIAVFLKLNSLTKGETDTQSQKMLFDTVENLRRELQESGGKNREELQQRIDQITQQLTHHQTESTKSLQSQFSQTSKIIGDVTQKLTQLDETNKQVKDFASQMQSLEGILKNPKHRAVLSEYWLESLLGHVLQPQQYKMQHNLGKDEKTGQDLIVDAVVFFKDSVIPIDAKFSLEKYNQMMEEQDSVRRDQLEKSFKADLKARIDETAKYIQPEKGTTEFSFMFMPAEGIFYNLMIYNVGAMNVNTLDLHEYAFKKHVIIVSPSSFFAYLQTVIQGLKALKVEESVKDIQKNVHQLSRHLNAYSDYMEKVGGHLGTTVGAYNNSIKEFKKIDKDIYKITDKEAGGSLEVELLDKPQSDE